MVNRIKISENFSLHEFECKDGSHLVKLDESLIEKLQQLRNKVGKPITVNSGYRTPEYNAKVGGSPDSQHLYGKAADIVVSGMKPLDVAKLAEEIGFNGIGVYDTFTHVDTRTTKTKWGWPETPKVQVIGETYVVEVDPMDLKISVQNKAANIISLNNFVTPGYIWWTGGAVNKGDAYPLSILVSDGYIICDTQPHGKPAGTFIVYKDGRITVEQILNISKRPEISKVKFAVGGANLMPMQLASEGFVGAYSDIKNAAWRPIIGYNPTKKKAVIAVRPDTTMERAQLTLKNLGCDRGITLDGGGSTVLKVDGKLYKSTTRKLYSVITW